MPHWGKYMQLLSQTELIFQLETNKQTSKPNNNKAKEKKKNKNMRIPRNW